MNFRDNIKEHQDLMKENIEHLQKNSLISARTRIGYSYYFLYVINQKLENFKK